MITKLTRRAAVSALVATGVLFSATSGALAEDKVQLRLATSGSETDQRSVAMAERLRERLRAAGWRVQIDHRDLERE